MRRQNWRGLGAAVLFAALPATAVMISQSNLSAAADEESGGRVVQISPDDETNLAEAEEAEKVEEVKQPKYWIGLQGSPIDSTALRTHLQLADDVGVLVATVVPGSPAEKAGLREHDVIVSVNGEPISDLEALQKVVAAGEAKPIELKVIRLAKESTVEVTPEERPANATQALPGGFGAGFGGGVPRNLEQMLQGLPGGVRVFGNGMVMGQGFDVNEAPNGVSVSITREGDGPAKITVKKGDQTWTVEGDDEKALKELPDDVRPFVQKMLQGSQGVRAGGPQFNLGGDLLKVLPDQLGRFDFQDGPDFDAMRQRSEKASERLMKRMEQMERRLQQLQEELQERAPGARTNEADDPSKT